jgi:uncharacterized OsmC-like protein
MAQSKTRVVLPETGYQTSIYTRDHVYHADEPTDAGGTDTAVTPTEMLLGALGSCIAITLRLYAERKKWDLQGVELLLDSERFNGKDYGAYEGDELFVHEIRKSIVLKGDLDDKQRERLMEIAGKCPVHRIIATPTFFVDELLEGETLEGVE